MGHWTEPVSALLPRRPALPGSLRILSCVPLQSPRLRVLFCAPLQSPMIPMCTMCRCNLPSMYLPAASVRMLRDVGYDIVVIDLLIILLQSSVLAPPCFTAVSVVNDNVLCFPLQFREIVPLF